MPTSEVLKLVKLREGIKSDKRDDYINKLIQSSVDELGRVKGIALDLSLPSHQTFVADWTFWNYIKQDVGERPRYLSQQLHDFQISFPKQE